MTVYGGVCYAWCLAIHLGSSCGSLLAVGILLTAVVVTAAVAAVDNNFHCCRIYVVSCGVFGVTERTVDVVEEGIA